MGSDRATQGQRGTAPGTTSAPGRVLVVDDNNELRRGFRKMLQLAGHVVVEASDGREATAIVARESFDVVVSDVQMPDMDGIELLRRVHESDPDLPVLLISGDPDLASALKAVEYGALEYLTKPVTRDKFTGSIARAVEVRRQRAAVRNAVVAHSEPRVRAATDDLTGALLAGRYRIGARLGIGGMGTVYEAEREDLAQMPVAIKVLHASLATDADVLMRFKREAHTVAGLEHPNIVRILDFQADDGEPAFLVMERLRGMTLGEAVNRGRHFTVEEVSVIAVQVLAALEAAHGANIVHRDMKPDNVFLTSYPGAPNSVKLLDFGVAKLVTGPTNVRLTQTGMVMGTPAYMAPEQARGGEVDPRCDLYAVGCLMFEALTGRAPFVADNYNALLYEIQQGQRAGLRDLRPDLEPSFVAVVDKAMSTDVAARFQSAHVMADTIAHWAEASSISLRRARHASSPAPDATPSAEPKKASG